MDYAYIHFTIKNKCQTDVHAKNRTGHAKYEQYQNQYIMQQIHFPALQSAVHMYVVDPHK